ncbi:GAF domain-containing protein [Methylobacterium organophilum]|uniref:GAF domain-containing protein n=1 Tax=Methylobacterium organophilum TaxID=410 RepID=UPI001F12BA9D|nr:GAF domain-containing protein [Methylobacterium organophilum]UMY17958.1 GAF domain-containing protein [Methylobacterium organophilum]
MLDDRFRSDPRLVRAADLMDAAQSLDDVVVALRQTARWIVGADGIAIILRENDFCHYVAEDAFEPLWRGCRFALHDCVSGWAMLHGETVIVPDIRRDPRVPAAPYVNKSLRSLVVVPVGEPAVAALGAYWCAMVLLDDGTVSRLEALARFAGDALARLEAAGELSRTA